MAWIIRIVIVFIVVVTIGCATQPGTVSTIGPDDDTAGPSTFLNADLAFSNGQYAEALDGFNRFLREVDDDRLVDAALFKIGKIFQIAGRGDEALAVFSRLRHEFPDSPMAAEAMLETLRLLYDAEKFEAAIQSGIAYTDSTDPGLSRSPYFGIIADAYATMGLYLDATRFYYRAWNTASAEESAAVWEQLKHAVEQLDTDDLDQLITGVTDRQFMGLLLYRLGMAFILDENYDDALDVLTAFKDRFAGHPDYQDALDMIDTLTERARFTPFRIGCLVPLSGPYAIYGQRALNGIELALNQAGEMGNGIPFEIIVKDSQSDAMASEKAVAQLDEQRVGAILGPMSASEAAATHAQGRGIPIFVFTQRRGIPDIGPYVFRNFITPQMQVRSLVSFAVEELGVKRFGILYPEENYGRRYMNLFWDQVIEYNGVVTGVEAYDPQGTDFAIPIKKLGGIFYDPPIDLARDGIPRIPRSLIDIMMDAQQMERAAIRDPIERISGLPFDRDAIDKLGRRSRDADDQWHPIVDFDAVFIPDAPKKAGLAIPQLAYYDIRDVHLLGTNLWNSKALLDMSGDYMKNTLIVDGFFAQSRSPKVEGFVSAFKRTFGKAPGIIEAVAYDSAQMVLETMRQTATDSRRELRQALMMLSDYDGVSGRTGFAENGEADKTLEMLRIDRGRFVQAQRTPDPESASDVQ